MAGTFCHVSRLGLGCSKATAPGAASRQRASAPLLAYGPVRPDTRTSRGNVDEAMGLAELELLCADRPMPTNELADVNTFYGHGHVLRTYARIGPDEPLYAVVPHSPTPDPYFVWNGERLAPVPAVMSYPDYRATAFERATSKRVIPSASPYVYVTRMAETSRLEREGTIFFPAHSTHNVTADIEAERLAGLLAALPPPYAPVTVCLYWRDVELGRHRPFHEHGLRLASAGHLFDPSFLFRFHELAQRHRFASGSTIGSHLFLSVASGCQYLRLPGMPDAPPSTLEGLRQSVDPNGVWIDPRHIDVLDLGNVRTAFLSPEPDADGQRQLANRFLATHRALEPADLRDLLRRLRRDDRFQVVVGRRSGPPRVSVPPVVRRSARRIPGLAALRRRLRGMRGARP